MHGGQESDAAVDDAAAAPSRHVLVGLPYTERALNATRSGGTPYGASHVSGGTREPALTEDEKALAQALGRRVAGPGGASWHVR